MLPARVRDVFLDKTYNMFAKQYSAFRTFGCLLFALTLIGSLSAQEEKKSIRLISIAAVGDMMLGTNYPSPSYLPANGGRDLLTEVAPILQDADVTFGNLEGTILNEGGTAKRCSNPAVCYVFRSPESYIDHYVNAGFDVLSIANNHSGDFGATGRKKTKALDRKSVV